ncbi:MAG: hypothetical protein WGN25_14915 [Candidatus Electrothrix sp. GW3-4]|uniref:hypothetical protein n=1 Tax=Candidatus Electrothrix sp. GW3-4 TaxID=3126740 RepID=UPI0030CCC1F5
MIRKSQSESCRAALADTGTVQNHLRTRNQSIRSFRRQMRIIKEPPQKNMRIWKQGYFSSGEFSIR